MSYLFPKRISELANIDSDLDTPDKRGNPALKNSYRLPKRVADIDVEESDSDSENESRLNCAILNDSFIITPSRKMDLNGSITNRECNTNENDQNAINDPSVESGFSQIGTDSGIPMEEKKLDGTNEDGLKLSYRPLRTRTQLFGPVVQEKTASVPSVFRKSIQKDESDSGVPQTVIGPRRLADARAASTKEDQPKAFECSLKIPEIETPMKAPNDFLFATPSLRPLSFSIVNSKKSVEVGPAPAHRSERKEKPQKILFTTPISRPPPGSLLESTPIESRKAQGMAHRKLSPIKEPSAEKEKSDDHTVNINGVDYIIDKKIGSGGSSQVFLAKGKRSGSEFAIKFVNLDGDQLVIDGYLNETKLLAKLQGNKSVVSLFDYCHLPEKNLLYMVMEKGESDLHKILQEFKTHIPLYTLMSYWHQMLQAVEYIHRNGVIHSDLKPANFLMINGRLKLIDFGIASNIAIDSTSIIKFTQAGTFNYISPDALIDISSGDSPSTHHQPKIRLSTKSDVWSLGCIFYLFLYKKTPFSHIKVLHQKVSVLTNPHTVIEYPELPSFYPPMLVEMVRKCLVYNPKVRSSVTDLLEYPFEMIIPIEN